MSRIVIGKWGGSLAVRIPKSVAEELQLEENMKLDSYIEEGKLVFAPARKRRHNKYKLDELLAQMTPENTPEIVSTGHAVGNEVW